LLFKRHEERCEALYYGLGVVQEGDTWRAPAEGLNLKEKKRLSRESNKSRVEDPVVVQVAREVVSSEEERPVMADDATPDRGIVQEAKDYTVSKA